MHAIPYLNFDGNCREAFAFYEQALGAKQLDLTTWGESPMAGQAPPDIHALIMHAHLQIDEHCALMGSDSTPQHPYVGVKGAGVTLDVEQPEQAERLFAALAQGGTVTMPMEESFWAQRFGMLTDAFGVPWMVNCSKEDAL